ncbi:MAG: hypothetical protein JSW18_04400 [Candidatus Omnitrophota bacterium]|nr:MAG: hypothetical protein JSW18_04400 [Candidatus Omnitrophota bacterium]
MIKKLITLLITLIFLAENTGISYALRPIASGVPDSDFSNGDAIAREEWHRIQSDRRERLITAVVAELQDMHDIMQHWVQSSKVFTFPGEVKGIYHSHQCYISEFGSSNPLLNPFIEGPYFLWNRIPKFLFKHGHIFFGDGFTLDGIYLAINKVASRDKELSGLDLHKDIVYHIIEKSTAPIHIKLLRLHRNIKAIALLATSPLRHIPGFWRLLYIFMDRMSSKDKAIVILQLAENMQNNPKKRKTIKKFLKKYYQQYMRKNKDIITGFIHELCEKYLTKDKVKGGTQAVVFIGTGSEPLLKLTASYIDSQSDYDGTNIKYIFITRKMVETCMAGFGSSCSRQELSAYLENSGVTSFEEVVLVDVGQHGSVAKFVADVLQDSFDVETKGYLAYCNQEAHIADERLWGYNLSRVWVDYSDTILKHTAREDDRLLGFSYFFDLCFAKEHTSPVDIVDGYPRVYPTKYPEWYNVCREVLEEFARQAWNGTIGEYGVETETHLPNRPNELNSLEVDMRKPATTNALPRLEPMPACDKPSPAQLQDSHRNFVITESSA